MKLFDKVIIVSPDMDTMGVGFLFNVGRDDEIEVVKERATEEDLRNPRILCIEAGGDGEAHFLNFDHHTKPDLPSATYQAKQYLLRSQGKTFSPITERIVSYIHTQDTKSFKERGWKRPNFLTSLSDICSGMAISTSDLRERFLKGIEILREVERLGIDPFGEMPMGEISTWQRYANVQQWGKKNTESLAKNAKWSTTRQGRRLAVIEGMIGNVISVLFHEGAEVVVYYNPEKRKFTVEGKEVSTLLPILNTKEKGWGGQGRVIASPRGKLSSLTVDEVVEIVKRNL